MRFTVVLYASRRLDLLREDHRLVNKGSLGGALFEGEEQYIIEKGSKAGSTSQTLGPSIAKHHAGCVGLLHHLQLTPEEGQKACGGRRSTTSRNNNIHRVGDA